MSSHLEKLARRAERDPFFLGCFLALCAKGEGQTHAQLASALGCAHQDLVMLRLCRAPDAESPRFQADVDRIAARFHIDPDILLETVRRGQALFHMGAAGNEARGTLSAARDADPEKKD